MATRAMETLSIRIPRQVAARLRAVAKRSGRTKTDVVLAALERQLAVEGGTTAGTFLDAAKDLAGCIEGPSDLSTNTKYMAGFGRS